MKNYLNTIIVEDEISNQQVLTSYLGKYCPQVNVLNISGTYFDALNNIQQYKPSLVFLDIQLDHNYTAFDLLAKLEPLDFYVIFITAYDEYARQAINNSNAVFYITKPMKISELEKAVDKVSERIQKEGGVPENLKISDGLKSMVDPINKFMIPVDSGYEFIHMEEVVRCQSLGNYVQIFTTDAKRYTVYQKLGYYEKEFDNKQFFRVHRSHLVNLRYVVRFEKIGKGGYLLMKDETRIPLAPRHRKMFVKRFR